MSGPRRIVPGVYMIGGPDVTRPEDCCIYLVEASGPLVMIDAGAGSSVSDIVQNIRLLGFEPQQVDSVIVTHGHIDHAGGLWELKQELGLRVIAHELELPAIEEGLSQLTADYLYRMKYRPVKVDMVLRASEEVVEVGGQTFFCLHTPGHTPGSISVYVDIGGQRVLFGQDIHGPFSRSWGSDRRQWRDSMLRLLELEADVLCEGHFGIYSPRQEVRAYIEGSLQRFLVWPENWPQTRHLMR